LSLKGFLATGEDLLEFLNARPQGEGLRKGGVSEGLESLLGLDLPFEEELGCRVEGEDQTHIGVEEQTGGLLVLLAIGGRLLCFI
jgi:predicted NUDIX family NTP pyrophosphohydrolase